MVFYDTTQLGAATHRSGLTRVSSRLRQELGGAVTAVDWDGPRRCFVVPRNPPPLRRARTRLRALLRLPARPLPSTAPAVRLTRADWLLTVELFSELERPGFRELLARPPCRLAAVFHDAIPLRWPDLAGPHSVRRHPEYLQMLERFDRVYAVSETSRQDLLAYWRWRGGAPRARVETLQLGADFDGALRARAESRPVTGRPALLCVGMIEPRKNQLFLFEVAESLWRAGVDFELHVVGRVNKNFGRPIAERMAALQRREPRFHYHGAGDDLTLARLYARATALAFPTIAEGCGLPLLEALWRGAPCVCSDLPELRENAGGGGCMLARVGDTADWADKLRAVLTDAAEHQRLRTAAMARALPRWADTAAALRAGLTDS